VDAGQVHVKRVDTALDAGTVVNPEMVKQQFEGAAVMGTSLSFYGEITATNGVIDQSNFDNLPDGADEQCPEGNKRLYRAERCATGRNW